MTRDLYLQVKEVNIVEEPISILSRNFVLFVFFVAKTSTYKRFNNAFGGQSTSRPRAEVDSGCKITVRNEVGGDAARLRCGTRCGPLRQYYGAEQSRDICRVISRCGTGRVEVMCDYGAEPYVVPGSKIMVRTVRWMSVRF